MTAMMVMIIVLMVMMIFISMREEVKAARSRGNDAGTPDAQSANGILGVFGSKRLNVSLRTLGNRMVHSINMMIQPEGEEGKVCVASATVIYTDFPHHRGSTDVPHH